MDEAVARSLARWPNVPAVYGWLRLDRRGNWLIRAGGGTDRFERIANLALREFIGRNYEADALGRWYFQNGPQRVYVRLAYTPLVVRHEGDSLLDQCDRPFTAERFFLDEEGSLLAQGSDTVALLDDRDLQRYADCAGDLPVLSSTELATRFSFQVDPRPG